MIDELLEKAKETGLSPPGPNDILCQALDARLPFPNPYEIINVGDAIGFELDWPTSLVILETKHPQVLDKGKKKIVKAPIIRKSKPQNHSVIKNFQKFVDGCLEEAMNFMSYVAEVSRGWDEPNAQNMGRMKSQPDAKGKAYILNDGIDMKAKIATMARRLEELEMKKIQEVQAISQTPLQPMPCSICLSYENLVEECPTIPTVREMFGDCNTYNSNWRDHQNFSWKPQPPQYQ
ncbi:hypothetical protein VitviT2T_018139 [Vitis vinifera]|uniref:Uncharacterized protein n=1 Tax=Vitis vinifera TaxID=29760 RepID=A0ABY9CX52_VITVI|nr:hypothetical protein VitviT2T_018139 [Vitis vinifera]